MINWWQTISTLRKDIKHGLKAPGRSPTSLKSYPKWPWTPTDSNRGIEIVSRNCVTTTTCSINQSGRERDLPHSTVIDLVTLVRVPRSLSAWPPRSRCGLPVVSALLTDNGPLGLSTAPSSLPCGEGLWGKVTGPLYAAFHTSNFL